MLYRTSALQIATQNAEQRELELTTALTEKEQAVSSLNEELESTQAMLTTANEMNETLLGEKEHLVQKIGSSVRITSL